MKAVSIRQFADIVPGDWRCVHSDSHGGRIVTHVYQNCQDAGDVRILSNSDVFRFGQCVQVPGVGRLYLSGYRDDPALADLNDVLTANDRVSVLRYRPGKRITLRVSTGRRSPIIIKCVSHGVGDTFDRLQQLYELADILPFSTSQPLWKNEAATVMAQQCLDGDPIAIEHFTRQPALGAQIASAISGLHQAPLTFPTCFGTGDQQKRSEKYRQSMVLRFPELQAELDNAIARLNELQVRLDGEEQPEYIPIHGALHSHQWLFSPEGLALVDFDRCSMGDAELDVATFLAEWDYEPAAIGEPVKGAFMSRLSGLDPVRLGFYRAHKHLAKAYKASRSVHPSAVDKVRRNLQRLLWVLADARRIS